MLSQRNCISQCTEVKKPVSPIRNDKKVFCKYDPVVEKYEPINIDFTTRYNGLYNQIEPHNYEKERFYGSKEVS